MKVKKISAKELRDKLNKQEVILIDVRSLSENKAECIGDTCCIPLDKISSSQLPVTDKPIVLHCGSGKRSDTACQKLLSENPDLELYSLEGGINAWKNSGYITDRHKLLLPLDRQMQVTAGFFIFFGVLCGATVDKWFYLIPGFFGLGLMMAGITGWCGMMKLLAIMPWNKTK